MDRLCQGDGNRADIYMILPQAVEKALMDDLYLLNVAVSRAKKRRIRVWVLYVILNRISKKIVLAIEVDGYEYHKNGTVQAERDRLKDHILELYKISFIRFKTNGSGEKEMITEKLDGLVG